MIRASGFAVQYIHLVTLSHPVNISGCKSAKVLAKELCFTFANVYFSIMMQKEPKKLFRKHVLLSDFWDF
jgi:hypothetical protein